jgi:hypothetical protein
MKIFMPPLVAVPLSIPIPPAVSTPVPLAIEVVPAKVVRSCWRYFRDYRGRQDGAHFYEIAARALERGGWILQHRHTSFPFHFSISDGGLNRNDGSYSDESA